MNIVLKNTGTLALPVVADNDTDPEDGQLNVIQAGETYELDDPDAGVLSVGDNPSFLQEFAEALAGMVSSILALFARFGAKAEAQAADAPRVAITLTNDGTNALRVLCDSNTNETTLDAGATADFAASRYVEIRELGV